MKILFVCHGFPPNEKAGAETYSLNLAKSLAGRHDVYVFTRTADMGAKEYSVRDEVAEGVKVRRVVNNLLDINRFTRLYINEDIDAEFEKFFNEVDPDIVHIQHLIGLSGTIVEIVRKREVPVVMHLHDYYYLCPMVQLIDSLENVCEGPCEGYRCAMVCGDRFWIPPAVVTASPLWRMAKKIAPERLQRFVKYRVIGRKKSAQESLSAAGPICENAETPKYSARLDFHMNMLNSADLLIAPSKFTRRKFIELGIKEDKIKALYYGIPKKRLMEVKKQRTDKVRFGYIGTFLKHKGLDTMVEAFAMLPKDKAELYIHGYGGPDEALIIARLKRKAAGARVNFMGSFAQSELPGILAVLDVLVTPSTWYETLNIVAREGILSGTPVIASRIGGLQESVEDGVNGFLFEPGNSGELYQKMMKFVEDPELADKMKGDCSKIIGIEEHAELMEKIYIDLIEKRSQARNYPADAHNR
ncbi:MAG TPA: glycosyltransferase family 4 protein [Nitrospirota bacterium]|jgi:glycosyltransferase involved in cell wall biosynthesis